MTPENQETIIIQIDLQTGGIVFETEGFEGQSCLSETDQIKDAIGTQSAYTMKTGSRTLRTRATSLNQTQNRNGTRT